MVNLAKTWIQLSKWEMTNCKSSIESYNKFSIWTNSSLKKIGSNAKRRLINQIRSISLKGKSLRILSETWTPASRAMGCALEDLSAHMLNPTKLLLNSKRLRSTSLWCAGTANQPAGWASSTNGVWCAWKITHTTKPWKFCRPTSIGGAKTINARASISCHQLNAGAVSWNLK